jgi:pyruvate ferredoxin oxidoreductase gamma subunit
MPKEMTEIRWHARGGQGAKTAATLVAQIAIKEGKYSQGFPEYGPERMGAPIRGYTRISSGQIRAHSAIEHPDVSVVLDDTLLETVDPCEGMEENAILIVNTTDAPEVVRKRTGFSTGRVYTVDATKIAIDEIGRPIPNTPMMGALVKATGILELDTVLGDIRKKFEKKFGEKIVQGNINAVKRAHDEVKAE